MAKRGSTRRASSARRSKRESADDEFAWQGGSDKGGSTKKSSKKKKSKKSTRSSGKSKSASSKSASSKSASSSTRKKSSKSASGKSSSTRKKAKKTGSTRSKRRRESDDGDLGGSGRRRRAAPAKKKGVDPIIPISIVSVTLLLCLGIFLMNRPSGKIVVNEDNEFQKAMDLKEEGMQAFREFNKYKKEGPPAKEIEAHKLAVKKLQAAMDQINSVLDKYRDQEGMLPPKYEGYESEMGQIAQILVDLEKSGRIK